MGVCALLAASLAAKLALFDALEYAGDIFAGLQMSRSWAWGRPFLYENGDGLRTLFHIYYTTPLFYPLTAWMGAKGLVVGSVLIEAAAILRVASFARRLDAPRGRLVLAAGAAFLAGPIFFWMLDDPIQGWHVELLFLPLGVLFALDLLEKRRRALLWAFLMVATREEGAVFAWALHALHAWQESGLRGAPARRRLARITAGWLLVFGLGLLCIKAQSGSAPGPSRIAQSFAHLKAGLADPSAIAPLGVGYASAVLLWGTGAILVLAGFPARALARAAAVSLPLLLVMGVGSLYYEGQSMAFSGPSWGPRFVYVWAVLAAALLHAAASSGPPLPARSGRAAWLAAAVVLSFCAQAAALRPARYYRFLHRASAGRLGGARLTASTFSAPELALLGCLGERLPHETSVLTNLFLFAPFDRQDTVWPDKPRNAWRDTFPQVVLCDFAGRFFDDGCLGDMAALPKTGFERARAGGLVIAWGTSAREPVVGCLRSAQLSAR